MKKKLKLIFRINMSSKQKSREKDVLGDLCESRKTKLVFFCGFFEVRKVLICDRDKQNGKIRCSLALSLDIRKKCSLFHAVKIWIRRHVHPPTAFSRTSQISHSHEKTIIASRITTPCTKNSADVFFLCWSRSRQRYFCFVSVVFPFIVRFFFDIFLVVFFSFTI